MNKIKISVKTQAEAKKIVAWCQRTFAGSGGKWVIYHNQHWASSPYELVLTPVSSEAEMLIKLRWL